MKRVRGTIRFRRRLCGNGEIVQYILSQLYNGINCIICICIQCEAICVYNSFGCIYTDFVVVVVVVVHLFVSHSSRAHTFT